jgi:predicted RNA binding protein YcfA (HicA-like mRNA interferase family)
MRLPRNISAEELIRKLVRLDYQITRQVGSHIRLTRSDEREQQHITIPNHSPLRVGTLNNILQELALQMKMNKNELIDFLFG